MGSFTGPVSHFYYLHTKFNLLSSETYLNIRENRGFCHGVEHWTLLFCFISGQAVIALCPLVSIPISPCLCPVGYIIQSLKGSTVFGGRYRNTSKCMIINCNTLTYTTQPLNLTHITQPKQQSYTNQPGQPHLHNSTCTAQPHLQNPTYTTTPSQPHLHSTQPRTNINPPTQPHLHNPTYLT